MSRYTPQRQAHFASWLVALLVVASPASAQAAGPEPTGWYAGDMHAHRSCGGSPETVANMFQMMSTNNLAAMSLLADMGNGEVQDPAQDLPRVNGQDDPVSTPGRILHWDAEWHWDPIYFQYPHQALGGHVVSLGVSEAHQIWQEYTYPIFQGAHDAGGIAGFAHMQYLDNGIPQTLGCCGPIEYPVEVALGSADFISEDVVDAGSSFAGMDPEAAIGAYYRLLNTGFRPGLAAGTDYPCNSSRPVGGLLTYGQVAGGQMSYRAWVDAIASGRTVVSRNGHNEFVKLLVNGTASPGDRIDLAAPGNVTVTVDWTATQNLTGTIELVYNGAVVASKQASVSSTAPATLSATVSFPHSGWLAARRTGSSGHVVHTAAVFVIVAGAPVRASAADANFYVQWMDNLLAKTSPGGEWNYLFPSSLAAAQARYQAARAIYQQIAAEAAAQEPPPSGTIWSSSATPGVVDSGPDTPVELGVKFRSDVAGFVTGVRFYKAAANTGTHVGNLWSSTGALLASATFTGESTSGWQQVNFATPVPISANAVYVASYHTSGGHYSDDQFGFSSTGVDSPPLHALADGVSGPNGVFAYGSTSTFPAQGWNSSNYWVDVAFRPQAALASITVLPASPTAQSGATLQFSATAMYADGTMQDATAQATWSSSNTSVATVNASGLATTLAAGTTSISATLSGISGSTSLSVQAAPLAITTSSLPAAVLNVPYSATVAASGGSPPYTWSIGSGLPPGVSMNASTGVLSGTPTVAGSFTFTVTVTDRTGSSASRSLSISVAAATDFSLWPAGTVPGLVDGGADSPVELGVKFRSDVAGYVKGIRFYKAAANTGTHVGNLWSSSGTRLATVTFSGETASGWQLALFSTPVAITANTVYVASYHANGGHYSADLRYFSGKGVDAPPLHALADGVSGGDGVYAYGSASAFPNQTWSSANYWVDVLFSASPPPTLASLAVTPAAPTIKAGTVQQFAATGTYSDGSKKDLTAQATWASTATAVATVSASGLATALSAGTTTISAALGGISGSTSLTVQAAATLVSVAVTPTAPTVQAGSTQQFVATGTYSDGSKKDLTAQATWASSATAVATVSASGLATALSGGTTTISATVGGIGGSTSLTVQVVPLAITTTALPNGFVGTAYSATLAASGGSKPYTWTIAAGLPPGLTLNRSTGAISGTPTITGAFTFDVTVSDAASQVARATLSIVTFLPSDYSLWARTAVPVIADAGADSPVELGVKFRADVAGVITGIRFYKAPANTGTHVGNLWSSSGTRLATATFTGETASGWQQVTFATPVAITGNTVYVASYHTNVGHYCGDASYFKSALDAPPLHALADGGSGPNGVFAYGSSSAFPSSGWYASNYWVDVVFRPSAPLATLVSITVTPASPVVQGLGSQQFTATGVYSNGSSIDVTRSATWTSSNPVVAAVDGAGNASALTYGSTNISASFAGVTGSTALTFVLPPPPPDEGPGGPILVVSSTINPFSRYYAEILRAEGLNEFTATDIAFVTSATLAGRDVVILGEFPLTAAQVTMLTDWVNAGGNLIAMRPDGQLASLLGLIPIGATLSEGYLLVSTGSAPGNGIVGDTMQYHGTADMYSPLGASVVATLYATSTSGAGSPAVTLRDVGAGRAAAFTYDLARSVVYTRQGNPAWSGQERDGVSPIRSDDLFFGDASFDPRPDWLEFSKVQIPQADEQQRLLANLILHLNRTKEPLPRFWYLPSGFKAAVVMTGDDHAGGGTVDRFTKYMAASPASCSVADWQCIRSTSYVYASSPITDAEALSYSSLGFEVALHVTTDCSDFAGYAGLDSYYLDQLAAFGANYPSVAPPVTNRTHCIVWSDYDSQPLVELAHGIRLDANYYYWPGSWIEDLPGLMNGSGMPMRFADRTGQTIDVYQAVTQLTDESEQSYPLHIDTLLDNAVGAKGYYGVFTANMHTDLGASPESDAIIASAQARGVPVVSARQMLTWLDGRNASSFGALSWDGSVLGFNVTVAAGARNILAMLPVQAGAKTLSTLTRSGVGVAFSTATIKGVSYAFFSATTASYQATYR